MTKLHQSVTFRPSDTWSILGLLYYADGVTPFNLGAGCNVQWILEDASGNVVASAALVPASGQGTITITNPLGQCIVSVPPALTEDVVPGTYTDQLQAEDPSGYVSTQWIGPIVVGRSFFA